MCGDVSLDSSTMKTAGGVLSAFGAGYATMGAYRQAQAEKAATEYKAKIAANNAKLLEMRSQDAIATGQQQVAQQQLKTRQLRDAQIASAAARGVDIGEGSPLRTISDTEFMGSIDALTIGDNVKKEVVALRNEAANATANASLFTTTAKNINPLKSALGTALTTGAAVADRWVKYAEPKATTPKKTSSPSTNYNYWNFG